ncbi:hypothetical protein GTY65_10270 [Streptomyces sp. SID8379]|uniref:DUF6210 family protein n=1 Tax=unclassified Streptomyces TaxID=2593676 RepID=UPI0003615936|nr:MULTISPECIES: DUF6210 family protein [unclassified Streptomyces]MYW64453.1 hypothetical protein [Streptomyces sp. SID8379]
MTDQGSGAEAPDGRRRVFLDVTETGSGWVFVVVAAPTGVVYQTQGGGVGCIPYEQEGYLLPLYGTGLDDGLNELFVGELKGWGSRRFDWPAPLLDRLREEVAALHVYGSANRDDTFPSPLVLDESRLAETDEAWVPVLTPDGPGFLVWQNSD